MTHIQQTLEALRARDLDVVVAQVVFGERVWSDADGHWLDRHRLNTLPCYSTAWAGFGELVERMYSLGWTYDVDATAPEKGIDVSFHPKNPAFRAKGTGSTLPRAACIAAILAVQGVG